MSSARSGDIQSLQQCQDIGGNVAYAVLLKLNEDQWKLVVILSLSELFSDEEIIFSTIIHPKVRIEIYEPPDLCSNRKP